MLSDKGYLVASWLLAGEDCAHELFQSLVHGDRFPPDEAQLVIRTGLVELAQNECLVWGVGTRPPANAGTWQEFSRVYDLLYPNGLNGGVWVDSGQELLRLRPTDRLEALVELFERGRSADRNTG